MNQSVILILQNSLSILQAQLRRFIINQLQGRINEPAIDPFRLHYINIAYCHAFALHVDVKRHFRRLAHKGDMRTELALCIVNAALVKIASQLLRYSLHLVLAFYAEPHHPASAVKASHLARSDYKRLKLNGINSCLYLLHSFRFAYKCQRKMQVLRLRIVAPYSIFLQSVLCIQY